MRAENVEEANKEKWNIAFRETQGDWAIYDIYI